MSNDIITVADGFWNFRGSFKIGGVIDVGTQAALVRLASGRFVLLDSYTLSREARRLVTDQTDGGEELEAVINLHPFHTLHVSAMHRLYPGATHYGTARHHDKFPDLPWADTLSEDPALHEKYADDFEFTVPRGVDFISANLPQLARMLGLGDSVSFHPTLAKALERRAGASGEFRDWARELIENWGEAENLCAAHTASLLAAENRGKPIRERLEHALGQVEKTLIAHQQKHG